MLSLVNSFEYLVTKTLIFKEMDGKKIVVENEKFGDCQSNAPDGTNQDNVEEKSNYVGIWADTKVGYSQLIESETDDSEDDDNEESSANTKDSQKDDKAEKNLAGDGRCSSNDDNSMVMLPSFWEQGYIHGAGHGKLL